MDIVRNMPRIDRDEFDISVYAFMGSGELDSQLVASGIELVMPNSRRPTFRTRLTAPIGNADLAGRPRWHWGMLKASLLKGMSRVGPLRGLLRLIGGATFMVQHVLPLARHIRRNRTDIVHCFLPHAYIVGGLATLAARGRRLVMSRVSSNFYMDERPIYRFVETWMLHKLVDTVICNSQAIQSELVTEGVPAKRIVKQYNGIDLAPFAPSPERQLQARRHRGIANDELVLTCVANLHAYKGHANLIAALGAIKGLLPQRWRLVCAGRDVDGRRVQLERAAADQGIGEHIQFLGSINDVPELLAASDIHVHPSCEEGLPNSILEAMASQLPIVATTIGGIPELVIDGEGGLLVPPRDVDALAQSLTKLISNKVLRGAMGRHNMARAEALFPLNSSVRGYEQVYRSLVSEISVAAGAN